MHPIQDVLMAQGRKLEAVDKRPNICGRCGSDHDRPYWICAPCEAAYQSEVREKHADHLRFSVPRVFRDCSFFNSTLQSRVSPWSAVVECRNSDKRGVVLMGDAGEGKTSLAVAKLFHLASEHGGLCLFVDAYELARARQTHPLGEGEAPLVGRVLRARTVVIDDVGAERQDIAGTVGEVIFDRHAAERRTIVTTGQTEEQLRDRYGAGVHRRLFEDSTVIKLGSVKP